jgi:hypothetical protein
VDPRNELSSSRKGVRTIATLTMSGQHFGSSPNVALDSITFLTTRR